MYSESPLSLGGGVGFPPPLESLLPSPDSAFHLGDLGNIHYHYDCNSTIDKHMVLVSKGAN